MAAVNIHSDFGAQENTICTASTFPPSICHDMMGLAAMILFISMLNFKTAFHSALSPSTRGHLVPLHFVTLVWYLSLLIFLLAILIPAWDSLNLAFCMMNSAYNLNKQDGSIQLCHTPFPILNQSVVPCLFQTVASCPAFMFFRR